MIKKRTGKVGNLYRSNDKLYTGMTKLRIVVVVADKKNSIYISRVLSLKDKEAKKNALIPIKRYNGIKEDSGVDYRIYRKTRFDKKPLNAGSMQNLKVSLDDNDLIKVLSHVKWRGGKKINHQRFKRRK